MMDFEELKRDVCWYLIALAIAVVFLLAIYYSFLPRLCSGVVTFAFISLAFVIFYFEPEDFHAGVAASLFASILPLGYAMAKNPFGGDRFYVVLRLYIFGFALIGFSWTARLIMDWLDEREENHDSPRRSL